VAGDDRGRHPWVAKQWARRSGSAPQNGCADDERHDITSMVTRPPTRRGEQTRDGGSWKRADGYRLCPCLDEQAAEHRVVGEPALSQ
jgi:hypothetical protein